MDKILESLAMPFIIFLCAFSWVLLLGIILF